MAQSAISRRWASLTLLVSVLAVPASLNAQASPQAATGCQAMLERWRAIAVFPIVEWRSKPAGEFRGEATDLDDSTWEVAKKGASWDAGSIWLRARVEIPASRQGYEFRHGHFEFRISMDGDYPVDQTAFINGIQRAQGYELEPIGVAENPEPGLKILIAVKVQAPAGKIRLGDARLELAGIEARPDPANLLAECVSAELLSGTLENGRAERERLLETVRWTIDWAALERSDQRGFDDSLRRAREKLEPLRAWLKDFSILAVGNAHIDMAWLWPWTETVEVVRNTFSSVLQLMQEFPDFKFSHGAVQTYAWMEDKYPALFNEIRRRVQEGRWEIVGGMWVEPDLNMPDGESLVRQLLVGKRYVKEKFGVDVRIGWNPDSFGYDWQLPQIYKKSGIDFFVTQKLGWNDTTRFPYKVFWWEAPDGSRVLTYFPHDYVNSIDPVRISRDLAAYTQATGIPELMHLYGVGDHGGGPTRRMLESARRWQSPEAIYPSLRFSTAQTFFDQIAPKQAGTNLPVWKNELYLEYHRGTYTTQAQTKKNNRRNEELLLNAEKFSSLASLFGRPYRQEDFSSAWKKLLFNQFHDILPGSGIAVVYRDAARDQAEVQRLGQEILSGALDELAARVRTEGPGAPVVVFNPLAWPRTDVVEVEVGFPNAGAGMEVRDARGKPVLADVVARHPQVRKVTVRFLAEEVPSLGYAVFHVVAVKKPAALVSALKAQGYAMENEFLRVQVDPKTGCITSLFDKAQAREALAPGACGNLLQAFRDTPRDWDAWNIDADFEKEKWDLTDAEAVNLVENSSTRAVIRVIKKFQNSRFVQDLVLYPKIPRLDVHMEAGWHENHVLLKVAFPVAVRSDAATFEIPYGTIERPTTRRTPEERAKFEVPALRWADLSDGTRGVSLLNDSKYGYDVRDNVLRLTLLRSPTWPDPEADRRHHEFVYSVYPHAGSWKEAGTARRGYELNYRLLPMATEAHAGSLPPAQSFAAVEPESVVLTAIKKAEDDSALVFRFVELGGSETQVRLHLPADATRAVEVDLQEREEHELALRGREVTVPTRAYEIKSIKVQFAAGVK